MSAITSLSSALEITCRHVTGKDNLDLPSPKRSMLVTTLYDMFQESQKVDSEAVSRLVKLAR